MNLSYLNCSSVESASGFLNSSDPAYFSYRKVYITILFTLGTCGILMNMSMICFLIRSKAYQQTALGLLFLQLFISNFFVAVFCLLPDGIWNLTVQWYGGDLLCRIIKFLQMFSLYVTTLMLTSISIETCITLTFPLTKSRRTVTFFRVKLFSITSWVLAALSSIPQAVIFHVERAPICEEFYQCVTHGFYSHPAQELAYTMITLCLMCLLPLAVIIFCYVTIAVQISNEAQMVLRTNKNEASAPALRQGTRMYQRTRTLSLWMSFVTAMSFVVCWTPYYATMIAHLFKYIISHQILGAIFCFGTSFCVINPIIFGSFILTKEKTKVLQLRHAAPELTNIS